MMASLHYFPISREVAERLGSRGRLAAHPFADGQPDVAHRSAGKESLMEEARRENDALRARLSPALVGIERGDQASARFEPCLNFGPVAFGEPISFTGFVARFKRFIRHLFAPRHASEPSMSAQPRLHYGNPSPDFPPDPPSGVRRDECGGGGGAA